VANCRWYQQHWRQTMGTISNCRYLKVNLKAKIYIHVSSIFKRCPNKIITIFLIEDFFHLATPVVNLEHGISPRIFKKIWNGPNGETDSWKKPEVKNLMALSF
jgi:hypothetical protein